MEKLIQEIIKLEEQRKNTTPEEQAKIDQELERLREAQKKVENLSKQVKAGYEKLSGLSDYRNPGVSKEAAEQLESIKKLEKQIDEIVSDALKGKVKTPDDKKVLTDEEIDKKIAKIKEELEAIYESAGPSKEELDADPKKREEEQKLLAELMSLNELKKRKNKTPEAKEKPDSEKSGDEKKKPIEVDYNLLLDLYNQELANLMEMKAKYEEGKVEYAEVKKVADEVAKKYSYVLERYTIEVAKVTGAIPKHRLDELMKITGRSVQDLIKEISEQSGKAKKDIMIIDVDLEKNPASKKDDKPKDDDKDKPAEGDDKTKVGEDKHKDQPKSLSYNEAMQLYKESLKKLKELEEQYKAGKIGYEEYKKHALVVKDYYLRIAELYKVEQEALVKKVLPPEKVSTYDFMTQEQIDSEMKNRKAELLALKREDPEYSTKFQQLNAIMFALAYEKRALEYKDYTNQDLSKAEEDAVKALISIQEKIEKGEDVDKEVIEEAQRKLRVIRHVKEKRIKSELHLESANLDGDIQKLEDEIKNFSADGDKKELEALKQQLEELKKAQQIREELEKIERPEKPQFIQEKSKATKTKIKYVAKTGIYQIIDIDDGKETVVSEMGGGHEDIEEVKSDARTILQDDFDKVIGNSNVNYDPVVLIIYYKNGGVEAAKKYIAELSKGKDGKPEELLTEIEYDLEGLKQVEGLNKKQKKAIQELASSSEGVATITGVKPSLWQRFVGLFKKKPQEALPEAKPVAEKPDVRDTVRVEPEDRVEPNPDRKTVRTTERDSEDPDRDDKEQ